MRTLMCLALVLSSCGDNHIPSIPKGEACEEQADAWCDRLGYASSGCRIVYRHWCAPDGITDTPIELEVQDECLDAIAVNARPDCVPSSCLAVWAR